LSKETKFAAIGVAALAVVGASIYALYNYGSTTDKPIVVEETKEETKEEVKA
jgi:hypothetical protein